MVTALVVALTERPRPEYIYGLTVGLIAVVGIAAMALLRRADALPYVSLAAFAVILVSFVALPFPYHSGPRPLADAVTHLQVVKRELQRPSSVLIASGYNSETCNYLAENHLRYCSSPSWQALKDQVSAGRPLSKVLDKARATVIYADAGLRESPAVRRLLANPGAFGWRRAAGDDSPSGSWSVLVRADPKGANG
jgi:hypothetical protein